MNSKKQHLLLARPGYADLLVDELQDRWHLVATRLNDAAVCLDERAKVPHLDQTIFARQALPLATHFKNPDLDAAVAFVLRRLEVMPLRANRLTGRWTLHAFGLDDDPATERATKLEKAVLAGIKANFSRFQKRFCELDELAKEPVKEDLIVQLYIPAPDELWLSTATVGYGVSPYVAGNLRMRERAGAPSRSARKLDEAFVAMGRTPREGETAVDLGAAPGGWTFSMARLGVRVTAVDHGKLTLPETKKFTDLVVHLEENGLKYVPPAPVDWLCSDMLIGSQEALRVLSTWLDGKLMRNFVMNVKLPQTQPWPVIKDALALLAAHPTWASMKAKHLYHDRREITLMGSLTKE